MREKGKIELVVDSANGSSPVGTFSESYDECSSTSNVDGPALSSPSASLINSNAAGTGATNSSSIHSSTQLTNPSTSLPCTVSTKRPQKPSHQDDLVTSNSLVQTSSNQPRQQNKLSNGNDDEASSSKAQKKSTVKSSNTQSRRQQKKPETRETVRAVSRDSSSSHQNGFTSSPGASAEATASDLQISKLENDLQRLNQSLEKQKASEMQLRAQMSELKTLRKDFDDLRAENAALQTK